MALDEKCLECQEATEEELLARLDEVLAEYSDVPGALIPVLQIAQAMFGYLPETALRKISAALGKPYSEVAGVVGFYSFFTTVPRGKHLVRVCLGRPATFAAASRCWPPSATCCGSKSARPRRTGSSRWTWAAASGPAAWPP